MTTLTLSPELHVTVDDDSLTIAGDLTRHNGSLLVHWLQTQPAFSRVDLSELDIEDGVAAAEAVNAIRLLHRRVDSLELVSAPQLLAHNLYRTGLLLDAGIVLRAMREDEAYG